MAEKVKQLSLERDYKKYLYFVDGQGNVSRKPKSGESKSGEPKSAEPMHVVFLSSALPDDAWRRHVG